MCIYLKEMISTYKDIGIAYISSSLKASGNNVILRYPFVNEIDYEEIKEFAPDYIGLTVYDITKKAVLSAAKKIKEILPDVKICLGGYFATFNCKYILESTPWIDYVIRGEGEIAWVKLVQSFDSDEKLKKISGLGYRRAGKVLINDGIEFVNNLDTLPPPDRSALEESYGNGVNQVITARGCTSNCSFCSSRRFWKKWRGRNSADIIAELVRLQKPNDVSMVIFLDSSFEDPDYKCKRLRSIAEGIIQNPIHIVYYANFRAEFYKKIDDELFDILFKSGLRGGFIGIEAGNERDLELYRKRADLKDNVQAVEFFAKKGIPVDIGFINFNPYSSFQQLEDNVLFLRRFGFSVNVYHLISRYQAYNCCDLYERIENDSLLYADSTNEYSYQFVDKRIHTLWNFLSEYIGQLDAKTNGMLTRLKFYSFKYLFVLSYVKEVISKQNVSNDVLVAIEEAEVYNKKMCLVVSNALSDWFLEVLKLARQNKGEKEFRMLSEEILRSEQIINYFNLLYKGKVKLSIMLKKNNFLTLSEVVLK